MKQINLDYIQFIDVVSLNTLNINWAISTRVLKNLTNRSDELYPIIKLYSTKNAWNLFHLKTRTPGIHQTLSYFFALFDMNSFPSQITVIIIVLFVSCSHSPLPASYPYPLYLVSKITSPLKYDKISRCTTVPQGALAGFIWPGYQGYG